MPLVPFESLPDDARVWVFGANAALNPETADRLLSEVDAFLDSWAAHGTPLTVGRGWRYGQFLLVGVDERSAPPSGCSIDACVRFLKEQERALGLTLVDNARVFYRGEDGFRAVSRSGFRALAEEGAIDEATVVLDPVLTRLGEVRGGALERPAGEGWHRSLLRVRSATEG